MQVKPFRGILRMRETRCDVSRVAASFLAIVSDLQSSATEQGVKEDKRAKRGQTRANHENDTKQTKVAAVVKTVLGSHVGLGEFTSHFRLPILVLGLNRMYPLGD